MHVAKSDPFGILFRKGRVWGIIDIESVIA
jgi:hypothetical protein